MNLIYHTIKHLKSKQIIFRLYYTIYNPKFKLKNESLSHQRLYLYFGFNQNRSIIFNNGNIKVKYLNKVREFKGKIDWNYSDFGKLWTYNLNYFDFLFDTTIDNDLKNQLINDFIDNYESSIEGKEPYTISLRGINWIKYFTLKQLDNKRFINHIYSQYNLLNRKIEYHIMGNHVLENGFSLLFAAYYFGDKKFLGKAKKILFRELEEQILNDGGHFERSPMYHKILLERLLESIYLVRYNKVFIDREFEVFLSSKAKIMLSWVNCISYSNNEIPIVNDCVRYNYPKLSDIKVLARKLKLEPSDLKLGESGYRKIRKKDYEICVDVGNVGPDYQPGHAHSDTFSFELNYKGFPIIVDTGTSTYEIGDVRNYERSTEAHNTVKYNNYNQSEVWGGFRVARRAKVIDLDEKVNYIHATHNGYKRFGVLHTRSFKFEDNSIIIEDFLDGKVQGFSKSYLHFDPSININRSQENKVCIKGIDIEFSGLESIALTEYEYAEGFNRRKLAKCIEITFKENLKTFIKFNK